MSTRVKVVGGGLAVLVFGGGLVLMMLAQVVMGGFGAGSGASAVALLAAVQAAACNGAGGGGSAPAGPVSVIDPSNVSGRFTDEQKANAAKIVEQVKVDVRPASDQMQASIIALATAMQESTLRNLNYGDRDSIGLFQQRNAWASRADRLDPHKTTHLFLTGGHGGQRGLLDIAGWQNMPVWQAAQTVQVSAFPTAYAKWETAARGLAKALMGAPSGPAPTVSPTASPAPSPTTTTVSCGGTSAAPTGPNGPVPTTGWGAPLPAGSWVMTSPFGWRMHPVVHKMKLHTGDDLAAPYGTPVYAVHDGTVKAAGPNDGYGNQVVLSHGGGIDSAYNHMSVIIAKIGQKVKAGQLVGKVGSTGMSTGNHLHFEIRQNEKPIDPVPFMKARGVKLDR